MAHMSRRQRLLATLVLAAGAAASIATSQVWSQLEEIAPLPGTILDVAQPSVSYRVHAELTGPVAQPGGSLEVHLDVTFPPDRPNPAALLVIVADDADAENAETLEVTVSPASPSVDAYLTAFSGCEATPCVADFIVWIERADLAGPPITPIMIAGEVRAYVDQPGEQEPPAGAALTVTVERQP